MCECSDLRAEVARLAKTQHLIAMALAQVHTTLEHIRDDRMVDRFQFQALWEKVEANRTIQWIDREFQFQLLDEFEKFLPVDAQKVRREIGIAPKRNEAPEENRGIPWTS